MFYGGLILAVMVALWYVRRHKLPMWTVVRRDRARASRSATSSAGSAASSPAAATASATTVPWAVTFTDPFAAANVGTPLDVPLHPTQLYEAGAELIILLGLLLPGARRDGRFPGGPSGATCSSTGSRGS